MKKNDQRKKRIEFKGEVASSGMAIGEATIYGARLLDFPKYWIHDGEIKNETRRFRSALYDCKSQIENIKSKLCRIQGREQINILESQALLIQDEFLVENTIHAIEKNHINAEWACFEVMEEIKGAFSKINQSYIQERKTDIDAIQVTILQHLMGLSQDYFKKVKKDSIVVAHNLSPAESLYLMKYRVQGFLTETGGPNSHTAIVARSLEIPSLFGIEGLMDVVSEGDKVIIDSQKGKVLVNPFVREIKAYQKLINKEVLEKKAMQKEATLEAKTKDGYEVHIHANFELLDELDLFDDCGAEGIGLYRTEYLFLNRKDVPSEEEQEKVYKEILKKIAPYPVTIRTVDLGADKLMPQVLYADQPNPALGLRAIRFCMKEKKFLTDQLRALGKASKYGNLKICIPMISNVDEFRKVKKVVREVFDELEELKDKKIPLGIMVETPSAAMEMDLLAREVDFFSVGTNDLIQYLLAVDRTNELVSHLYTPFHPSVIRTLKRIIEVATQFGKEVVLCGEMAADPLYLFLLIALGYNQLSMNAASIPRIKKMIRSMTMEAAKTLLAKVLVSSSHKETKKLVQATMEEVFPEHFE